MGSAEPYDAWLFDADGTLFDTRELIYRSFSAMTAAFGRPPPDRAVVDAGIGMVTAPQIERLLGPLSPADFERALAAYRAKQAAIWPEHLKLFPGVAEGLRTLAARGGKLAVVTSRTRGSLDDYLSHTGIAGCFAALVTPECTRRHKPDPEPVRAALDLLHASPERAVMVGDAVFDIQSGHAAGVDTVLVAWGGMDPRDWPVQPGRVVHRFGELLDLPERAKRRLDRSGR